MPPEARRPHEDGRARWKTSWRRRRSTITASPTPGKVTVQPTKAMTNQRDLSLAYSPGVAVPCLAIRDDPGRGVRLHRQGQPRRGGLERHRRAGPRQHRRAGRQAGHGRQGLPVQEVRRHRRLRHRGRRDRPGQAGRDRGGARADLRRHQPRGHQGARVLPRSSRRSARRMRIPVFHDDQHGTAIVVGRGAAERARGRRQADRRGQARLLGRGCRRHRLPRPRGGPRRAQGEHLDHRQQGRGLRGPPPVDGRAEGPLRPADRGPHARRHRRGGGRVLRPLGGAAC